MGLLNALFGTYSEREVKRLKPTIEKINSLDESMQKLSDEELKSKTVEFRERLKNGETLDDILAEAFADYFAYSYICHYIEEQGEMVNIKRNHVMNPYAAARAFGIGRKKYLKSF